ncbi:hypothetical protein, variant [Phytophthora nicotianae P1976]|uniref:Uncharacterized protein n=1 Tax=Phytophthora nicotianae P1976 TaxID=1317066 RepID=A0A080ZP21_PHYNI|nr:hypothetical protein, variant [Phytophthora nicotianae P1976]
MMIVTIFFLVRETSDQDALERIVEAAFKVPDDGSAVSYLRKVLLRSAFEIARRADIAEANYKRVKLEIEKKDDELKRVRLQLTASKKHVRWATEARGRAEAAARLAAFTNKIYQ